MQGKKAIQSKTIWFNVLSAIAIIISVLMASPEFQDMLGDKLVWFNIIGNVILRFNTSTPIGKRADEVLKEEIQANDDGYLKDF